MRFVRSMLLLMLCWLAGCAAPLANPETDALAKLMQPIPSRAVIYVFRNEPYSTNWPVGLSLDGKDMGSTAAETYFRWSVEPGQHIIVSHSENDASLVLNAEAGKVYYVWQDISMGYLRPRSQLQEVDRTTAAIALRTCYLLQTRS